MLSFDPATKMSRHLDRVGAAHAKSNAYGTAGAAGVFATSPTDRANITTCIVVAPVVTVFPYARYSAIHDSFLRRIMVAVGRITTMSAISDNIMS
jgi:hypothetical protein